LALLTGSLLSITLAHFDEVVLSRKQNLSRFTFRALQRRLREADFTRIPQSSERTPTHSFASIFSLLTLSIAAGISSLRGAEHLAQQLSPSARAALGLGSTPSDSTLSRALRKVGHTQMLESLRSCVLGMHARKELRPKTGRFHQVCIDGKQVHWLRGPAPQDHHAAQRKHKDEACIGATLRVLRVTHVGPEFCTCIWQMPIPRTTNEIGALPELVRQLGNQYGGHGFMGVISTDAGLCSKATAAQLVEQGWEYMTRVTDNQPTLLLEATRAFADAERVLHKTHTEKGNRVSYELFTHSLGEQGWLDWGHARCFVRLVRVVRSKAGDELGRGERIWVSSVPDASPQEWYALCRGHWGCENQQHCIVDKHLGEDQRLAQFTQDAEGLLVISLLRALVLNLLNVLRKIRRAGYEQLLTYKQACAQAHVVLCIGPGDRQRES